MRIALKLFASLVDRLPPEARAGHRIDLEVETGSTVQDMIRRQGIPDELCAIVLVDGHWVDRKDRAARVLLEGEVLLIWPPVAGG